ncbi:MAG TPA: Asp-tRNA(Asn)/Glu-tRNA(Gln) amidotransferase subunit GatC [Gammaproteobacteria bacterium]|nr:Asp-tRNA(Asn)/Glu-tRNA(Gln) amidotransferase subunit GatC [Gammaproteobacteria bacterium]
MSLDREEVLKIAHLARLGVDDAEVERYADELSNILALVDRMNAVDTSGVAPMAHPLDGTQRLRPDVVDEIDRRDAFQKIAPAVRDGLYLVPKVIE